MEPNEALAELKSLSSQIEDVAILGESGFVLASTGAPERGEQLARVAAELLAAAGGRARRRVRSSRIEVALGTSSVFVVSEGGRTAVATTVAEPTAGLVVYDLRTALGRLDEKPATPTRAGKPTQEAGLPMRRLIAARAPRRRSRGGSSARRQRARRGSATIGFLDGSSVTLDARSPELEPAAADRRRGLRTVTDDLGRLLVEHALLEGDFLLRSGKRSTWYLDKYRFETRPDLLRALGERLAEVAREVEPDAVRLAGPALGAVALAASASMASELPFIIVRGEIKEYGTANRIEGPFDRGDLVCLLEDVVTSGGALAESVSALRDAGLVVRHAVCVVDREEGGTDALARLGVRLRSLYRAGDLLAGRSPDG